MNTRVERDSSATTDLRMAIEYMRLRLDSEMARKNLERLLDLAYVLGKRAGLREASCASRN